MTATLTLVPLDKIKPGHGFIPGIEFAEEQMAKCDGLRCRRRARRRGVNAIYPRRPLNLLTSLARETQMHPDAKVPRM